MHKVKKRFFFEFKQVIISKMFWRWCIILCGEGFMDFIHRPKSKILKILKIKITTFLSSGEWRGRREHLFCWAP
jgi:hypothetical protein